MELLCSSTFESVYNFENKYQSVEIFAACVLTHYHKYSEIEGTLDNKCKFSQTSKTTAIFT